MDILAFIDSLGIKGRVPTISFLGVGVSNIALMGRLSGTGYRITLRNRDPYDKGALPHSLNIVASFVGEAWLSGIYEDVLILSPSVRRDCDELLRAVDRGSIITSDAELFFMDHKDTYAVTGSDGKSTTATLASLLLSSEVVGNIGVPFSSGSYARVAELSSFQLFETDIAPRRAIVTSISPNHLDWHTSYEEYYQTKLALLKRAKYSVISFDDEISRSFARDMGVNVLFSLSYDYPTLIKSAAADHYITLDYENILVDGVPVIAKSDIKRREWYNLKNLMGAMGLCLGEYSTEVLKRVAAKFPGLKDRCELIATIGGVDYINPSIDTSPSRTAATLSALGGTVNIILGGRGKGLSLSPLIPLLRTNARSVSIYGEARNEFYRELADAGIEVCKTYDSFYEAVLGAVSHSQYGDKVLLSPAATGYGEFKNYAERARRFVEIVDELRKK